MSSNSPPTLPRTKRLPNRTKRPSVSSSEEIIRFFPRRTSLPTPPHSPFSPLYLPSRSPSPPEPIRTPLMSLAISPTIPLSTSTQMSAPILPLCRSPSPPPKMVRSTVSGNKPTNGSKQTKTTSRFRLQGTNFFLTFPQCSVTKDTALERVQQLRHKLKDGTLQPLSLKGVVVAQEQHADGTPHLHLGLYLNERFRTSDPAFFDSIAQKHGNYQSMKCPKECLRYITKTDPSPLTFGTLPQYSEATRVSKSTEVAVKIRTGWTIDQVADWDPGYFMQNKKKIEDFASFSSLRKTRESKESLTLPIRYVGHHMATKTVIEWLNTNLFIIRPLKCPQLYLFGPPNSRKTSLVMALRRFLRIYTMPLNEDFYDFYNDESVDLIVLDEFKGQKTIQFLNQWLDGQEVTVRVKCSQRLKRVNVPFMILSNYSVSDAYKNVSDDRLDSLKSRLLEVSLDEPLDLDRVLEFRGHKEKDSVDESDNEMSQIL